MKFITKQNQRDNVTFILASLYFSKFSDYARDVIIKLITMRLSQFVLSRAMMDQARHLREIFQAALGSVQTSNLIQTSVKLKTSEESGKQTLTIVDRSFELKKPVYIIGFGKAVFAKLL